MVVILKNFYASLNLFRIQFQFPLEYIYYYYQRNIKHQS